MASRSVLTLAAATTAHAGAFALLVTMQPTSPAPAPAPGAGATQIDLDLSSPEPSPPDAPPSVSAASATLSPPDLQARFGGLAARIDPASALAERSLVPPVEISPPSPETASAAWTFSPFAAAPIDMRAAVTPDMVGPPHPPDRAEQPAGASTTGGLSEGLSQHDLDLGLGHGGAVLTAAEEAARSAAAPIDGSATFEVVVHSDGTVVARVTRAQGSASDWARVADAIGRTVDPRRMHLPTGRGWRVVVRVDAKVRLPDGRDVKSLHGPRVGVSESVLQHALEQKPGSGGWAEGPDGKTGIGDENTAPMGGEIGHGHAAQGNAGSAAAQGLAQRVLPTPHVSVSGKVCSASIGITPAGLSLSGGCSPENIGGHGTRVVSGHIVSEGAI